MQQYQRTHHDVSQFRGFPTGRDLGLSCCGPRTKKRATNAPVPFFSAEGGLDLNPSTDPRHRAACVRYFPQKSTVFNRSIFLDEVPSFGIAMRHHIRLEPCITCDKLDCGVTVILPSPASGEKHFNQAADRLDQKCPACNRLFSVSIFELEWFEVDEHEFASGFIGSKRGYACLVGGQGRNSDDRRTSTQQ